MKMRFATRLGLAFIVMSMVTSMVPAQTATASRLTGTVKDAQGALIPKAEVLAKHDQTKAEFKVTANDEGGWSIPAVQNGSYTVTVTANGFKSTVIQNVKVDAGTTASVNATLEVGGATEQVVVTSGGNVIQTESANVSSTILGRQISELPFTTRDAMQLVLTLPGVQTPGTPRTSSINGLPKSSLNISIDGANIQDNFLKSSDGFFTSTQAKSDAVEEVTISTATPGAESAGGGAVQIKFVTRSGSNDFHGGVFWQHRNNALNANYFFNNINGLPRDSIKLNQAGGRIGGPIIIPRLFNGRERAFFFINVEEFRLPQTYDAARTVLTADARQGVFTYRDSTGAIQRIDLYALAARGAGGRTYTNTPDPQIGRALGLIGDASKKGILTSRIGPFNDYNRMDLSFQDPGRNIRRFPTTRLDFNVTKDHHVEFVHNYQHYFSLPDGVNNILSIYPGVGTHLGSPEVAGGSIYRNNFTFAMAERWTISSRLVNEVRATSSGNGTSVFRREFSPALYPLFDGYNVNNPFSSGFFTYGGASRRNTPVKTLNDNLNWQKGTHAMNLGLSYTRIASFTQAISTAYVPTITLGLATNDPINNSTTNIFTGVNFPNSTSGQRTDAQNLYALLTGRMSATGRSATFDEDKRNFQFVPYTERNHQYEVGIYAQDSWKARSNLTLNYGLRWEFDPSPVNDNQVYTRTGVDGIFGVSGRGNLFKPGVYEGKDTQFRLLEKGEKGYSNRYLDLAPTFGFAWQPSLQGKSFLGRVFGDTGQTVLRGGYSIAYVREGFNAFTSMFGSNDGPTFAAGTNPNNFPTQFGEPGSKLLRNKSFPFLSLPEPKFPLSARQGASINDFNPDLRPGYVQSWTFGIQRELSKDTAIEIRYVGNHGTKLWRQYEISEVNIFENGFLNEFKIAQRNLAIFRAANPRCGQAALPGQPTPPPCNYGNSGMAGQAAIPIIQTGMGSATNLTTTTQILRGEAGAVANSIATVIGRMTNLIKAGLVPSIALPDPTDPTKELALSNFFVANPRAPGNSFIMDNAADSTYNAMQVELRRRMSKGVLVQGGYVWSKSLTNFYGNSAVAAGNPTTLRNLGLDKGPTPRDSRHSIKFDWIHELPFGPGQRFLNTNRPVVRKILEGWQWSGVFRMEAGTPTLLNSGRNTFSNRESGVELHNITLKELQQQVKIRKETVCDPVTGVCKGVVFFLPQSLIENSQAAFEGAGRTLEQLNPNAPYIGPPTEPGKLGKRIFLYGPWTSRWDLNLMKRTQITEKSNFEFRVQFLNAFNQSILTIRGPGTNDSSLTVGGSGFGQTTNAYRDFTVSGTNDPGGRLIEFQLRFNF